MRQKILTDNAKRYFFRLWLRRLRLPAVILLVLIVAQLHDDDVRRGEIRIRNPGGYFRQLVRLCSEGRYGLEAELMAMRRRKMT